MNNQKRGMGDQTQVKLRWKKEKSEKAKQPLLCLVFEVLPLADIGIQTHTKAHRLSLLFLCFLSASLASPSFISSTSLHLYPFFAPGIPRVPHYLPLVCCPGFDISSQKDQQHTLGPFLQLPRL